MEQSTYWENLKKIYDYESILVSGPGSYRKDINDVLWTFDEFMDYYGLEPDAINDFTEIIDDLVSSKQVLKISDEKKDRYITRTAEIARLLGHNYEYWYRGRQSIDSVRWNVTKKEIPDREIPVVTFITELSHEMDLKFSEDISTNLKYCIKIIVEGIAKSILKSKWEQVAFSKFQFDSAKEMIISQYKTDEKRNNQILTAGVGSGKTIGFSIGILVSALMGIISGESSRNTALLLYPRTALAQDQYSKIKDIIKHINIPSLTVHFEHSNYYRTQKPPSVRQGIQRIYGNELTPPPAVIITTLETLNRRLQHPLFIQKISKYLKRVVLDEVHLVEGLSGCNIVRLLDRLRQSTKNEILWTASSATVANPAIHAATVFGIDSNTIKVIAPAQENLKTVGMVHHMFLRPTGRLSFLGTLVNSSSILIHNRRNQLSNRDEDYHKTIGFADSLDVLGRWNSDFRENERTESSPSRKHPDSPVPDKNWTPRQREIPYALRFVEPFKRRLEASGGSDDGDQYEKLDIDGEDICDLCKKGKRKSLGTVSKSDLIALGKIVYRHEFYGNDSIKTFYINNPEIFHADSLEIGSLDLCPYLRAGACFWFSGDSFETEPISKYNYEWESVARSKIYSSKTKSDYELNEDLGAMVFTDTTYQLYDIRGPKDVQVDMVFSSPSLEVGVDISNVTESIMFKAIRNVASYRQKVGRIGREEDTDVININLLSLRPIDLHYYRQPRKLISDARLDPVPLKEHNESVLWASLYMGVWDYLAKYSELPEAIPLKFSGKDTLFTQQLRVVADYLKKNHNAITTYLVRISRGKYNSSSNDIKQIIDQVLSEVNLLLTPTTGTIDQTNITCISDIIVHKLNGGRGYKIRPPKQTATTRLIENARAEFRQYRPQINPLKFDLSDEFRSLDEYEEAGWVDEVGLEKIVQKVETRISNLKNTDTESPELGELFDSLEKILRGLKGLALEGIDPFVTSFLEQYSDFTSESMFKPYYLSYTLQELPIFRIVRNRSAYTRPPNLFTNPYEEKVSLLDDYSTIEKVPVSEAMFSFVPGTWTYRMGKSAKKVAVGRLEPSIGGVLTAQMNEMNKQGAEFDLIKRDLPAPPGVPSNSFDVYMPRKVKLRDVNDKYVMLNRLNRTIVDKDEDYQRDSEQIALLEEEVPIGGKNLLIKVPKSYLESWVHINSDAGNEILVNPLDENRLIINDTYSGTAARKMIKHPMFARLLRSIKWHDNLDVYDYIHSITRSYSTKGDNTAYVSFENNGKPMAIGSYYRTEGISIELNSDHVERVVQDIKGEMYNGENKWGPSYLKAYQSLMNEITLTDGSPISPFNIRDLVGILITYLSIESKYHDVYQIEAIFEKLLGDRDLFNEVGMRYFEGKYNANYDEEDDDVITDDDKKEILNNINTLYTILEDIKDELSIEDKLDKWIANSLLNTFGVSAISALQKLCGSNEQMIGYTIDLEKLADNKYIIYLYDRTHYGNGSTAVISKYMHILNIQRHGGTTESSLLPTYDYLTLLEQELMQCPQFHSDYDALVKYRNSINQGSENGVPELAYIGDYSSEILRVGKNTWEKIGIDGPEDAWKLPIIALAPGSVAVSNQVEVDDVLRSSNICWNGCPECVVNTASILGNQGSEFLDKAILDKWFTDGIKQTSEYKLVKIDDIAKGADELSIGKQSKLCLRLPNRQIRSVSLPFQVGYNIEKLSDDDIVKLLVRNDDVYNLRLRDSESNTSHGIESLGFKRILWFNLLTNTYLDSMNMYPSDKKQIHLVFYDCRDITFDDIGLSERMVEALDYNRKKIGFKEISSLSDMLEYLALQEFQIKLCVDARQAQEEGVKNFLDKLAELGNENIEIYTKRLGGSMHRKALATPYGIIQGSANLTFSGTLLNEETINFASYGSIEYDEMLTNIKDTFFGVTPWR